MVELGYVIVWLVVASLRAVNVFFGLVAGAAAPVGRTCDPTGRSRTEPSLCWPVAGARREACGA